MKEFVLHVPEDRSQFMMELLAQLGFERVKEEVETPSLAVQEFVLDRKAKMNEVELLDWEHVSESFVFQA